MNSELNLRVAKEVLLWNPIFVQDFSGSILPAFTVVYRMQQLYGYGYCLNTTEETPRYAAGPIHCNFFKEEGGERINNDGYGSTPMEAICDAALKACARSKA